MLRHKNLLVKEKGHNTRPVWLLRKIFTDNNSVIFTNSMKYFSTSNIFLNVFQFKPVTRILLKREYLTISEKPLSTYNYGLQLIQDNINLASQPAAIIVIKEVNLAYLYRKIVTCTIVRARTSHNAQNRYYCCNNAGNCAGIVAHITPYDS